MDRGVESSGSPLFALSKECAEGASDQAICVTIDEGLMSH